MTILVSFSSLSETRILLKSGLFPEWYIPGYSSTNSETGGYTRVYAFLPTQVVYILVYMPPYCTLVGAPCRVPSARTHCRYHAPARAHATVNTFSREVEGERVLRAEKRLFSPQNKPQAGQEPGWNGKETRYRESLCTRRTRIS